jgi:hypothetical protein
MQQLDTPAVEAVADECGGMPMPAAPMKPETPPPSMSVNVNAQGMDNIESMLALISKLNNAGKADMPSMAPMPAIMPLNKMIPDMDADNDDKVGGEKEIKIKGLGMDGKEEDFDLDDYVDKSWKDDDDEQDEWDPKDLKAMKRGGDEDEQDEGTVNSVGDDDASDVGTAASMPADGEDEPEVGVSGSMPDEDEKLKDDILDLLKLAGQKVQTVDTEAWDNEPNEEEKDSDYMLNKLAGGLNRPKETHPKVSDGDNPMQRVREGDELRAQIRAELLRRLEEAKGAQ